MAEHDRADVGRYLGAARPQHCRRCLYTDAHPLGLVIDEEGICSGCRVHEEKDRLDWAARWRRLEEIVRPYRSTDARTYDCIVPVTGGQDSYWIVHVVKERLKLNPLLVTYNRYWNTELGIRNLANLRIRFDCDILQQNVNPKSVRNVVRTTLRELGSIYWHCIAGQTVFPVQTAVRFKVPLIIWGAHQGLEQVGMFSHEHEVEMTRRHRKDHDLMGREGDDLPSIFDTLAEDDIAPYRYPDDAALDAVGVRGLYLGNFVRWDPAAQHRQMVATHGYRSARFDRSFDTYDHVDCWNYLGLHDRLKLFKHGYSKVTDHASREVRHGRLTRSQAVALVKRHELAAMAAAGDRAALAPGDAMFCEWLGLDPTGLNYLLDRWRHPRWWHEQSPGRWAFAGWSTDEPGSPEGYTDRDLGLAPQSPFTATDDLAAGRPPRYVIVGKGVD